MAVAIQMISGSQRKLNVVVDGDPSLILRLKQIIEEHMVDNLLAVGLKTQKIEPTDPLNDLLSRLHAL